MVLNIHTMNLNKLIIESMRPYEADETFTFEKAFQIQANNISDWRKILNAKAYRMLLNEVKIRNAEGYASPYDVCRGDTLNQIVKNLRYRI